MIELAETIIGEILQVNCVNNEFELIGQFDRFIEFNFVLLIIFSSEKVFGAVL